jgi:hypothetical protein
MNMNEPVDIASKRGTCPVCGIGCLTESQVKADHHSSMPADCPRAEQSLAYHNHPDRINFPMKRVGKRGAGQWQRISWDQAMDEIAAKLIKEARTAGTKIIAIDPRQSETAQLADLWLRPRPGSDGALAYGMIHVIINEGLYDKEFVERWCLGFEELKELVKPFTPEKVAELTWLPVEQILEVARIYATHKPGIITFGLGTVHQGRASNATVFGKAYQRAITGNLDVPGGDLFDEQPEHACFREEMYWDKLLDHPLRTRDNIHAHRWPASRNCSRNTRWSSPPALPPSGITVPSSANWKRCASSTPTPSCPSIPTPRRNSASSMASPWRWKPPWAACARSPGMTKRCTPRWPMPTVAGGIRSRRPTSPTFPASGNPISTC